MTLYRQLFIFTLLLFSLLFLGVWAEKLHATRSFLVSQLESHAQDTATSLGLSLSPAIADQDMAMVETMMNAVFDRGYYDLICLSDTKGKAIVDLKQEIKVAGVPAWFVRLVPLSVPRAEALIMSGWNQFGTLQVESHPGFAYKTLWTTVVRISLYFVLTALLVVVAGGFGLRLLLRPLKRVEEQAEAICRREYTVQEHLPKTRELRQVVESMNRMTTRVRDMFEEQTRVAERLRRNVYSDQLTGLGNRRYLNGQVEARLEMASATVKGALLLVQVDDLQKINEKRGFAQGDDLLKKVADILRRESATIKNAALARMTGGNFAVFLPEASPEDAAELADRLCSKVGHLAVGEVGGSGNVIHIGGVTYAHTPTLSQLLAEADTALSAAQGKGHNSWQVLPLSVQDASAAVKGKSWWRQTLETVLQRGDILLYGQPVVSVGRRDEPLYLELLSRIALEGGEIVSAGVFVPLAERLQMISRFDRIVLEKVLTLQREALPANTVAVNLSASSLADRDFVDWLLSELKRRPAESLRLIFEFSEFAAVQYLETVKDFSKEVERFGHGIALDHFGQSFANFGYLKSLRPEYVKVDRPFIHQLEREQGDAHFYVGSLCGVAHSLDIRVIAEGVEREEQAAIVQELNIDALQGYLVGEPKPLRGRRDAVGGSAVRR